MSRYDVTFDETWDLPVTQNEGFPYTFPFMFDRVETRLTTDSNETWDSSIGESGRYGVNNE